MIIECLGFGVENMALDPCSLANYGSCKDLPNLPDSVFLEGGSWICLVHPVATCLA